MSRFMHTQSCLCHIPFPKWARKWVNLRKAYCRFYHFQRGKLETMLSSLGMRFEGRQHSGRDDTRNIARVLIRMLEDGCDVKTNEQLFHDKLQQCQEASIQDVVDSDEDVYEPEKDSGQAETLCTTCHHTTSTIQDSNSCCCNGIESVSEKLSEMLLEQPKKKVDRWPVNPLQEENMNDLLAYYALQKS